MSEDSYSEYFNHIRILADKGNPIACKAMVSYLMNRDGDKNSEEKIKYMTVCAEKGDRECQQYLGYYYQQNITKSTEDLEKSLEFLRMAAVLRKDETQVPEKIAEALCFSTILHKVSVEFDQKIEQILDKEFSTKSI